RRSCRSACARPTKSCASSRIRGASSPSCDSRRNGRDPGADQAPMNSLSTDVVVIGAGTAGLAAYRAATAGGKRAILVENGPYGTTCARVGCMPSKLLIAAAEAAHGPAKWSEFGLHLEGTVR